MTEIVHIETSAPETRRRLVLGPMGLAACVIAVNVAVIVSVSLSSGVLYHFITYQKTGPISAFFSVGSLAALVYMLPQLYRNELRVEALLGRRRRRLSNVSGDWIGAFALLMLIGFLTKTTDVFSRGWALLFFMNGFLALLAFETALVPVLQNLQRVRRIHPRRLLVIGSAEQIVNYRLKDVAAYGFEIEGDLIVPVGENDRDRLKAKIHQAVREARALKIDDILILIDWSEHRLVRDIIAAFSMMPVGVHIPSEGLFSKIGKPQLGRIGGETTFSLSSQPLTPLQAILKRLFDIGFAAVALILIAPLLAIVAILIRCDSSGPVIFRQRRRGYNHREFQIVKFRTMTTMDDGDVVTQARKGDPRITGVGAVLRRWNIDELPQFWNVLVGDMSVVGPRPHAVAHDRFFERRIMTYPRRLNVRPGITGWAQVNGLRGETETDEKMMRRVEFDLAYIDNWSFGFDLYIVFLTIVSHRAHKNAR